MKLSEQTTQLLNSFSSINNSMLFAEGNVIKVRSTAKDLIAEATIEETIPREFAIYELKRLLNAASLFDDPEFDFESDEGAVLIGEGGNRIRYSFTDPSVVSGADYSKSLKLPNIIATFSVTQEQMSKVLKAASVLGAPNVTFAGKDGKLIVSARDKKISEGDSFKLEVGTTDEEFSVDFKADNMKMIPGNYTISVSERIVCKFQNDDIPLVYFVAGEVTN